MKLLHITFQSQYIASLESLLLDHGLTAWARHSRAAGRDVEGLHDQSQAFPGSVAVIQVQVPDELLDEVLDDIEEFRLAKGTHRHLEAVVLPVERRLGPEPDEDEGGDG